MEWNRWLFSAQFTVIGLALPGPSPFRSTMTLQQQKSSCGPPCVDFPDVLREERRIDKVPSTSCSLQNSAQLSLTKTRGGIVFIIPPTQPGPWISTTVNTIHHITHSLRKPKGLHGAPARNRWPASRCRLPGETSPSLRNPQSHWGHWARLQGGDGMGLQIRRPTPGRAGAQPSRGGVARRW